MEGKENKINGINMVLVLIIVILLGIVGYCAYRLGDTGRSVIDDENLQKGGNTSVIVEVEEDEKTDKVEKETALNEVKKVTINYEIQKIDNYRNKIIVNGVDTKLITYNSNPTIYTMEDALIIDVTDPDCEEVYVVDEKGQIVNQFVWSERNAKTSSFILLKGGSIQSIPQLHDKTLTIVTEDLGQSPNYVTCHNGDDYIVEYTYTAEYLGNGKFSEPKLIKTVTAKEYRTSHNITC